MWLVISSKKELRSRERGKNKARIEVALYIQRIYRAWVVWQELQERRYAAEERRYAAEDIQALYRGFAQRKRYDTTQKRVLVLQRYGRGWLARRWFRPALRVPTAATIGVEHKVWVVPGPEYHSSNIE